MSTRRSSRVVSVDASSSAAGARRHADSVVSAILRDQAAHERRRSKDVASTSSAGAGAAAGVSFDVESLLSRGHGAAGGAFDLPGIHISRIETLELDDETAGVGDGRCVRYELWDCDGRGFGFEYNYSRLPPPSPRHFILNIA